MEKNIINKIKSGFVEDQGNLLVWCFPLASSEFNVLGNSKILSF